MLENEEFLIPLKEEKVQKSSQMSLGEELVKRESEKTGEDFSKFISRPTSRVTMQQFDDAGEEESESEEGLGLIKEGTFENTEGNLQD